MRSERKSIRWRWVLPIAQLAICLVALLPFLPMFYFQLKTGQPFSQEFLDWKFRHLKNSNGGSNRMELHLYVPPRPEGTWRWVLLRQDFPLALNLPGVVLEIPQAILSKGHTSWVPRGMLFEHWRALSYPFTTLILWFVVGRSADALLALKAGRIEPRMRLWDGVAAVLTSITAFLGLGLMVEEFFISNQSVDGMILCAGIGGAIWTLLSLLVWVAIVRQWRVRRQSRMQAVTLS
jgi:hypothetical protein